jgi:hypothetical protein
MRAKGIASREDLERELLCLKIDPRTFPQDVADTFFRAQETQGTQETNITMAVDPEVDPAPPSSTQAEPRKGQKRLKSTLS